MYPAGHHYVRITKQAPKGRAVRLAEHTLTNCDLKKGAIT